MSTITREQIEMYASAAEATQMFEMDKGKLVCVEPEHMLELVRIALASLEAEPVPGLFIKCTNIEPRPGEVTIAQATPMANGEYHDSCFHLYAAPPAPVSVPDGVLKSLLPDAEKSEFWFEHDGKILFEGVKFNNAVFDACRDAMLHGAEPVSNRDELPLDYLQGHKDGLEWAAQLAEANHPHTGDWLYDDPIELAKAIRKGPDMPELKSVPADADDNFYSWFCREWEQNYQPNGYSLSAKKHLGAIAESAWFACRGAMLQGADGNSPAHSGCRPAQNCISPAQCGNSPVIPDGWVMVPVEPTMSQEFAGYRTLNDTGKMSRLMKTRLSNIYRAMIAAAPQQEVKP